MHKPREIGPLPFRLALWVVRMVAIAVPAALRRRWRLEWQGELWHARRNDRPALIRSFAALPHAIYLRWRESSLDALTRDLRYAVRQLTKSPTFTLVAVLTLALGIGANTLIFSVIDSTLVHPFPYRDADRLVYLWRMAPALGLQVTPTLQHVVDWRQQIDGLEQIEVLGRASVILTETGEPLRLTGTRVSPGFFEFLGVGPNLGRGFDASETIAGSDAVVVLSFSLWQSRFAADPSVIGTDIRLDDRPHTVIGVMPRKFNLPASFSKASVWLPLLDDPTEVRTSSVMARLRSSVDLAVVNEQLAAVALDPGDAGGDPDKWSGVARRPQELYGARFETSLWAFQGAVGFVLLIAATNVANLLLARGATRRHELAIRSSLGASRGRLIRQQLAESVLLALAGGATGLLLAQWGLQAISRLRPEQLDQLASLRMDPRIVAITTSVTLLTGLVVGLVPALQAAGNDPSAILNAGGRSGGNRGRGLLRRTLVVTQMALATVLLVGASLLATSFIRTQSADVGFDPDDLLAVDVHLPDRRYPDAAQRQAFWRQLTDRLESSRPSGISTFALASSLPPTADIGFGNLEIEGAEQAVEDASTDNIAAVVETTADYFKVLRIPLLAGRYLDPEDRDSGDHPIVINQLFADTYWPDGAVGKRLRFGGGAAVWHMVVGVVGNAMLLGPTALIGQRQIYYPPADGANRSIVARSIDGDPLRQTDWVRAAIATIDPGVPVSEFATVRQLLGDSIAQPRFNATLMLLFSLVALVLALIGIYGVLSYAASERTREFGIRMALGAPRAAVVGQVGRSGLGLITAGLVIGVATAAALSRLIDDLLYGLEATDPTTYGLVVVLLLATGLAACLVPATRASRVDPSIALRAD